MPHVNIKHFPKPLSDAEKAAFADRITAAVVEALGCPAHVVSVGLEPVTPDDWNQAVYSPEIVGKRHLLVRGPGY